MIKRLKENYRNQHEAKRNTVEITRLKEITSSEREAVDINTRLTKNNRNHDDEARGKLF